MKMFIDQINETLEIKIRRHLKESHDISSEEKLDVIIEEFARYLANLAATHAQNQPNTNLQD